MEFEGKRKSMGPRRKATRLDLPDDVSKKLKSCSVLDCEEWRDMTSKTTFHCFPTGEKNQERWEIWTALIRKARNDPSWIPFRGSLVCSHHFRSEDFSHDSEQRRTKLHRKAIPSIFPNFIVDLGNDPLENGDGVEIDPTFSNFSGMSEHYAYDDGDGQELGSHYLALNEDENEDVDCDESITQNMSISPDDYNEECDYIEADAGPSSHFLQNDVEIYGSSSDETIRDHSLTLASNTDDGINLEGPRLNNLKPEIKRIKLQFQPSLNTISKNSNVLQSNAEVDHAYCISQIEDLENALNIMRNSYEERIESLHKKIKTQSLLLSKLQKQIHARSASASCAYIDNVNLCQMTVATDTWTGTPQNSNQFEDDSDVRLPVLNANTTTYVTFPSSFSIESRVLNENQRNQISILLNNYELVHEIRYVRLTNHISSSQFQNTSVSSIKEMTILVVEINKVHK